MNSSVVICSSALARMAHRGLNAAHIFSDHDVAIMYWTSATARISDQIMI